MYKYKDLIKCYKTVCLDRGSGDHKGGSRTFNVKLMSLFVTMLTPRTCT